MLALDRVPRHLVVVGGSYIGLEFAQMFRRFGAEVTIVEMSPRLISREDEDVSRGASATILENEGHSRADERECITSGAAADGVAVSVDCTRGPPEAIGSDVLLAVGRRAEHATISASTRPASPPMRAATSRWTTAWRRTCTGIWALGDCNGRGAFTHTAYNDYEIVAANLLDGEARKVSDRVPAYALYIDPPLGRVGMTETQARATGRPLLLATRPMTRVGRAVEKGETQGFMKAIVDAGTRRILGASILGTGGDEAIHGVLDIVNARRAVRGAAARRADSPDRVGAAADAAGGSEASVVTV